jgi:hypothetical protein
MATLLAPPKVDDHKSVRKSRQSIKSKMNSKDDKADDKESKYSGLKHSKTLPVTQD